MLKHHFYRVIIGVVVFVIALSTVVLLVRYHPLLLRGMRYSIGNTTYMFQLLVLGILYVHSDYSSSSTENWDCRSHDRMVVGLTTTCAINIYHH
jgi:hypothetical protein